MDLLLELRSFLNGFCNVAKSEEPEIRARRLSSGEEAKSKAVFRRALELWWQEMGRGCLTRWRLFLRVD